MAGGAPYTSQVPRAGFPVGRDGPIVGMPLQLELQTHGEAGMPAPDAVPRQQPAPPDRPPVPQQRNLPPEPQERPRLATALTSVESGPAEEEHERASELAVLDGYNPNTWDPPLRFGDTVALLIEGYNGMVSYGGSADGKAWIQFLQVRARCMSLCILRVLRSRAHAHNTCRRCRQQKDASTMQSSGVRIGLGCMSRGRISFPMLTYGL